MKTPRTIKTLDEAIEEFNKDFSVLENVFGVDRHKDVEAFISTLIKRREEAVRKRIKKAFIEKYKGAGEVFFPYESEGNCTKEEEEQFIEQEWKMLIESISELGREEI